MEKGVSLYDKTFEGRNAPVRTALILSYDGKAFFGQDRVAVLTKTARILRSMNVSSNECERPAL
ncbi:lipopolysaccharide/colanic/teichoic acid biosynthesis glycosyltransferase [Ochrobactrum daejeonense]|uniref:Lipopolysaccharide/colanic/teichoic acid biosynthesis glycosyltransferase n=1 Tax=Brucella daejeonensis TaxID=659015 RepID=A0A7W9AVX5_9HYPH|nr:hypothetical protein [Brucella daejeonensis]MBB5701598.1 lipopolysaccharide/colanic/teichoic acid biosynthesis glycosyltransferase [Brucella daejeonensis]